MRGLKLVYIGRFSMICTLKNESYEAGLMLRGNSQGVDKVIEIRRRELFITQKGRIMRTTSQGSLTDLELQQNILAELAWEPVVDAANVVVTVRGGVVTLTGTVRSFAEKMKSKRVVLRLHGVQALAENLIVKLPECYCRTDGDIANAIAKAFEWDTRIPHSQIHATAKNGHVTLEGHVEWNYQRRAAARAIKNLAGITQVWNRIMITPKVAPDNVKAEIIRAFERSALVDARKVRVEVDGTKVRLSGTVRSWPEKGEAKRVARSAPGISQVDDLMSLFWLR